VEVCRVEPKAVRDELRRAGAGRVGSWLRRSTVTVEDAGGDVASNVH
jgi:hypothetical protein